VDPVAFNTVILGHCRERDFKEGHIRCLMKRLISLLLGYLRLDIGEMAYGWEMLERMLNSGHRPGTEVFSFGFGWPLE
jgi:hypothetical protein